jgi:hypothetical protein
MERCRFQRESTGLAAARIDVRAFSEQIIPACTTKKEGRKETTKVFKRTDNVM